MSIAILGWGSLLWEDHREFDRQHRQWQPDGPTLKIEFSRVSKSRDGALTLVLDDQIGSPMKVEWCVSKRETVEDAICDLRCREGTTLKNIGHVRIDAQPPPPADPPTPKDLIIAWASEKHLDAVVWTALKSNFHEGGRPQFTVEAAVAYVRTLPPAGKVKAAEYVRRAPHFVQTPMRSALQREPWFSEAKPPS